MTHKELLAICDNYSFKDSAEPVKALRAVVELHKPFDAYSFANKSEKQLFCTCGRGTDDLTYYPCPTIQAIEKELK